jgi:hypothetical protein
VLYFICDVAVVRLNSINLNVAGELYATETQIVQAEYVCRYNQHAIVRANDIGSRNLCIVFKVQAVHLCPACII